MRGSPRSRCVAVRWRCAAVRSVAGLVAVRCGATALWRLGRNIQDVIDAVDVADVGDVADAADTADVADVGSQ